MFGWRHSLKPSNSTFCSCHESVEAVHHLPFNHYINELINQQKISRIIFDEAHYIEAQKIFRQGLYQLGPSSIVRESFTLPFGCNGDIMSPYNRLRGGLD